mgnify:CR=1 FL=1
MNKKILVIGGTRFFGKILVQGLLARGHHVTLATRGNAPLAFAEGEQLSHIRVDRGDRNAMHQAFKDCAGFDVIYDQVCYHPHDAHIACEVFAEKVKRYVMTSTIEVYADHYPTHTAAANEDLIDLQRVAIDIDSAWRDAAFAEANYGLAKRQAEAYFAQHAAFAFVSVRSAHVYAQNDEFTGRFAHYKNRAQQGTGFEYSEGLGKTSFISASNLADFLLWIGEQDFVGPINAAANGTFSALDLYRMAGGDGAKCKSSHTAQQPTLLSPFDYAHDYLMSTARAHHFGYIFQENQLALEAVLGGPV